MSSKQSKAFLIGRSSITGRLMSVEAARARPATSQVEHMPKPGNGDTKPTKK